MLRYSVYYKAKNNMYSNVLYKTDKIDLEILDDEIFDHYTSNLEPETEKELNVLYNNDETIDISNGRISNERLNNINNIINLFEQLQLRFNNVSLDKCGSNIVINTATKKIILTNEKAHDLYVYLHRFTNVETKNTKTI